MMTKTEQHVYLEGEFETAITGEHRECYEHELDCPDLDALVEMMNDTRPTSQGCVQCLPWGHSL